MILQLQEFEPHTTKAMLSAARLHSRRHALRLLLLEAVVLQHAITDCLHGSLDLPDLNCLLAGHDMQLEMLNASPVASKKDRLTKHKHKHKRKRHSLDWLEDDDGIADPKLISSALYRLTCRGQLLYEGTGILCADHMRKQLLQSWMNTLFQWQS